MRFHSTLMFWLLSANCSLFWNEDRMRALADYYRYQPRLGRMAYISRSSAYGTLKNRRQVFTKHLGDDPDSVVMESISDNGEEYREYKYGSVHIANSGVKPSRIGEVRESTGQQIQMAKDDVIKLQEPIYSAKIDLSELDNLDIDVHDLRISIKDIRSKNPSVELNSLKSPKGSTNIKVPKHSATDNVTGPSRSLKESPGKGSRDNQVPLASSTHVSNDYTYGSPFTRRVLLIAGIGVFFALLVLLVVLMSHLNAVKVDRTREYSSVTHNMEPNAADVALPEENNSESPRSTA